MTRFKELKRIQRAIANRDEVDLRWATEYCRNRLKLGPAQKRWKKILDDVERAQTRE